jgi:hypothetical protein
MSIIKISEMTQAVELTSADALPVVNSGITKKTLLGGLADWVLKTYGGFIQSGTGAVARTVQAELRDRAVTPFQFGGVGDGIASDTAAVQAAINTGRPVDFLGKSWVVNNLTSSTANQSFISSGGVAKLIKGANGPIFSSAADDLLFQNLSWRGDAASPVFTGDGVVLTGNRPRLLNCGVRWISGRPLKATGSAVHVIGTCDIYQTTDTTNAGYDIEIGVSGTATLYHQLMNVYTSQSTGGILLTDTGSHVIVGGQFGKLTIAPGTSPAGINGGMTAAARILGKVLVGVSNAVFASNQFSAIDVEFTNVTSGCSLDESNIFANGGSITNQQGSNYVVLKTYVNGRMNLSYGGTLSRSVSMSYTDPTTGFDFDGALTIANGLAFKIYGADLTTRYSLVGMSGVNNNVTLGATTAGYTNIAGGPGGVYLVVNGASRFQATDSQFRPQVDNSYSLGTGSQRFSVVYAGTGTINTSDERAKEQWSAISQAEHNVAIKAKALLKSFRFKDAVSAKGDAARIHFGIGAQSLKAAFESEGLVAEHYAVLCYDEWPEQAEILDEDGAVTEPYRPAGNRYGVRYDELLAFIIAAL